MNEIGYFGIVFPGRLEFMGYKLMDGPEPRGALAGLLAEHPNPDVGLMGALLAEAHDEKNGSLLSTAALGISEILGTRYFMMVATSTDDGWAVRFDPLPAATTDEARKAFHADPLIVKLNKLDVIPGSIH